MCLFNGIYRHLLGQVIFLTFKLTQSLRRSLLKNRILKFIVIVINNNRVPPRLRAQFIFGHTLILTF